jgi:hypothetical protein
MSRYPFCACSHCWFVMARSAYAPQDFIRLAKRYRLTEVQQKVIDEMKLKLWNEATRGERAG